MRRTRRKGQISTEIIYSVGVMLLIFLLLAGITFNRKIDIRELDEYLEMRNACQQMSNVVSSISAAGENTMRAIKIDYNITVYTDSRIVVRDESAYDNRDVVCTYTGNVAQANLSKETTYTIINTNGLVTFT